VIRTEARDGVHRIAIDRPERRNAIDTATTDLLVEAIGRAQADPEARVLVIKGVGDTFCAGRDLRAQAERADETGVERDPWAGQQAWAEIFQRLQRGPVPSVAVVRGHAVAGGFTLAMACDYVLADRTAVFGAFEMRNGFAATICTPLLSRLVGPRLGLEFATFGEAIPAERLLACGLINRLAEENADLARIEVEFVGRLAALDRGAVRMTREIFRAAETMPIAEALTMGKHMNNLIAATGGFAQAGRKLGKKN